jgi:hypothetical protein
MQRTLLIAAALMLLLTPPAVADDFTTFRSRRYDVVTDLPVEKAKSIAMHMDKVFEEYVRRLARAGFRPRNTDRMNLYLFDDKRTYVSQLASKGVNATGSGGMFFVRGGESGLATFAGSRPASEMIATLQHEGFHQFAWMRIGSNLPTWANEGLAEYFGDALLVKGRFATGQVDGRRLGAIRKAIAEDNAFGFGELLNMSSKQWLANVNKGDKRSHLMYDQSWSIVHFLVHGENERYQPAFMAYLREIHKGRTSAQAFEAAFGTTDYEAFEQAWREYIEQLHADSLTLAHQRLSFLAGGLRRLNDNGVAVESIDQLKTELRKINYWYSMSTHGYSRKMQASEDENFQPPPPQRRGAKVTMTLEANRDKQLPPEVVVRGLQVEVRTAWSRDARGNLSFEVVYR